VVWAAEGESFVMADIPGIIEGAAEGAGLGHDFLRHIERCRLLIHVVDASGSEGRDPIEDYEAINAELEQYSPALAERPQLVAANKVDLDPEGEALGRFRDYIAEKGLPLYEISAATGAGLRPLTLAAAAALQQLPPIPVFEEEYVEPEETLDSPEELTIRRQDADLWVVEGPWLERLLNRVNLSDSEGRMYFDRSLRASGVFERLEDLGVQEGDTISMYNWEFEYKR
jgi:GTP-binding protein